MQAVNPVMEALAASELAEDERGMHFYLDAPGGSGKTYLFNILYAHLTTDNIMTSTAVCTGRAPTLLTRVKTLPYLFKLLVPLTETNACKIRARNVSKKQ